MPPWSPHFRHPTYISKSFLFGYHKSEIEEALVRIKDLEGVEGFVICNKEGTVLRHQVEMTKKAAEDLAKVSLETNAFTVKGITNHTWYYSRSLADSHRQPCLSSRKMPCTTKNLVKLTSRATNVARDLDPNDDLKILRIKTSRKEVIVSHEKDFIVIALQQWKPKSGQD